MSAIGPGDFVECIDDGGYPEVVAIGAVYLVEDAGLSPVLKVPCLILKGIRHPVTGNPWVRVTCFRPIYRPRAEFLTELLTDIPALIPEDA